MENNKDINQEIISSQEDYRYGFRDEDVSVFNTGKGLSREVVTAISKAKNEPEWMLEYRLRASMSW